jgi:hypothetical protein
VYTDRTKHVGWPLVLIPPSSLACLLHVLQIHTSQPTLHLNVPWDVMLQKQNTVTRKNQLRSERSSTRKVKLWRGLDVKLCDGEDIYRRTDSVVSN